MVINGVVAVATGITLVVVLIAKFAAGAWIVAILIPMLIFVMLAVKRHYQGVYHAILIESPICVENLTPPLVIVPLDRWTRITEKGLRFAMKISDEVEAVHVGAEECRDEVDAMWQCNVAKPISQAGLSVPKLTFLSCLHPTALFCYRSSTMFIYAALAMQTPTKGNADSILNLLSAPRMALSRAGCAIAYV